MQMMMEWLKDPGQKKKKKDLESEFETAHLTSAFFSRNREGPPFSSFLAAYLELPENLPFHSSMTLHMQLLPSEMYFPYSKFSKLINIHQNPASFKSRQCLLRPWVNSNAPLEVFPKGDREMQLVKNNAHISRSPQQKKPIFSFIFHQPGLAPQMSLSPISFHRPEMSSLHYYLSLQEVYNLKQLVVHRTYRIA